MRLAFLSDVHFDFAFGEPDATLKLIANEASRLADAAVFSGDIADGPKFIQKLEHFRRIFGKPTYFVLGNHDAYGWPSKVEAELQAAQQPSIYLTSRDNVELTTTTALVGEDGWYDGRCGSIAPLMMRMRDFDEVPEIKAAMVSNPKAQDFMLADAIAKLGDRSAHRVEPKLRAALDKYKHVVFVTHVPPFPQASWHNGRPSSAGTLPFYCSRVMGDLLIDLAYTYPDRTLTVLCGHSHTSRDFKAAPNLQVRTAWARYGDPTIDRIVDIQGRTPELWKINDPRLD